MNASLLWLLLACAIAPFAWGLAFALVGAPLGIAGGVSAAEPLRSFPAVLLGGVLSASLPVAMLAPMYALFLFAWPGLARRHPELEATRAGLAVGCALLAAPGAFLVAWSKAQAAASFAPSVFLGWGSVAGLVGIASLLLPRLLVGRLAPGAFR